MEVDYTSGIPGMTIVGLPDAAIIEHSFRARPGEKGDPDDGYEGESASYCLDTKLLYALEISTFSPLNRFVSYAPITAHFSFFQEV